MVLKSKGQFPLEHKGLSYKNTRAISQVKDEKVSFLGSKGFERFSSEAGQQVMKENRSLTDRIYPHAAQR